MPDTPIASLQIESLNLARNYPRQSIILNDVRTDVDIYFFQEPRAVQHGTLPDGETPKGTGVYGFMADGRWKAYHAPVTSVTKPPRAVTYCRTNNKFGITYTYRCDIISHPDVVVLDARRGNESALLINVYCAGGIRDLAGTAIQAIMEARIDWTGAVFMCGDFNLHHDMWRLASRPRAPPTAAAAAFADWAEEFQLRLLNNQTNATRWTPGNPGGASIIDLGWEADSSIVVDFAVLDEALSYGSDHRVLRTVLHIGGEPEPAVTETKYCVTDYHAWTEVYTEVVCAVNPVPDPTTTEGVDAMACAVMYACNKATKTVGEPRTKSARGNRPWWTPRLSELKDAIKRTPIAHQGKAMGRFKRAVASAKSQFWGKITGETPREKLFARVRALRGRKGDGVKALKVGDVHAATPDAQAALLGDTFFPPEGRACATETDFDPTVRPSREWVPFVASELQEAIQGTSNTSAPGSSGIGYKQIKCIAQVDAERLLMLYNASVELGHVPERWKAEKLVAVPKPRKTDMSSPKSYRPISLIETLSKVLEKMMATRLQLDCATHGLLPNNQFGGLRHVGTSDAGLALVHDVEAAWAKGETCVAIAADIQQFFPSVQHERLLHTVTLHGHSPEVRFWLRSFLSHRTYSFQIGAHATPTRNFNGRGVPQGSPLLPILAAIYIADAMDLPGVQVYVDDAVIKAYHKCAREAAKEAARLTKIVESRLNTIGLGIDRGDKLEGIVFAKSRWKPHGVTVIPVTHPDGEVTKIAPAQVWRYLGIYFTPTLSWDAHVTRSANKAKAMALMCRMLANCTRGLNLASAREVYLRAIRPLITYAAPVWYKGVNQAGLIKKLQVAQNAGVRWCLGAFRTSPIDEMHHLASIPPIKYVLDQLRTNASTRLRTVGARHGLRTRCRDHTERPHTQLTSLSNVSRDVEEVIDPAYARSGDADTRLVTVVDEDDSYRAVQQHAADPARCLVVYPDGSLLVDGGFRHVGAAAVLARGASHVEQRQWPLGSHAEVYDGEMYALAGGLDMAVAHAAGCGGEITHIMLASDNQSAVQQITKTGAHPMQSASLLFRNSAELFFNSGGAQVTVGWIRGHAGLAGNEAADALAKEAARMPLRDSRLAGSTVTYKRALAKRMIDVHWQMEWRHRKVVSTSALWAVGRRLPSRKFKDDRRHNTEWPLGQVFKSTRRWGARVMQVALGHGWFGAYRQRFNLGDSRCPCSDPVGPGDEPADDDPDPVLQTRWHLLYECPLFEDARTRFLHNHVLDILPSEEYLFGSSDGIKSLLAFLSATDAFGPIRGSYRPQVSPTAPPAGSQALVA
jgi:ribonuclease HI